MEYIKHIVAEMDESLIQRCLICGEVISDYRNTMAPAGTVISGFTQGPVYVSDSKNPQIYCTELSEGETAKNCNNHE